MSVSGTLKKSLMSLETLKAKQNSSAFLPPLEFGSTSTAAWISATLDDCISYGTLPFSILARHGFIAESLLCSLVRINALNQTRVKQFKNSFSTALGRFFQVYLNVNIETLLNRDPKRLYKCFKNGLEKNMPGMNLDAETKKSQFSH